MPFSTVNVLDRIWKKALLEKGCKIQLRPEDNLKLLVTRLRRRHSALKKYYSEAAIGRALQLYHIKVDTELLQLSLEFVDVSQDTLRYLVHELNLDTRQNEEYSHAGAFPLNGVFVAFPNIPDNTDSKVLPLSVI